MAVSTSGTEISSINKKDFPKKGNKILKIIDILHEVILISLKKNGMRTMKVSLLRQRKSKNIKGVV